MKKPNLNHAEVIRKAVIPESMLKFLSRAKIVHFEKEEAKEIGTENIPMGEWFVIERYLPCGYHKFATNGLRSELSIFRMAGGCNNIHAFDHPGPEKSEDYDSIPDEAILYLPNEFGKAAEIIEEKYIGSYCVWLLVAQMVWTSTVIVIISSLLSGSFSELCV